MKVLLICAAGMSTNLLLRKMTKYAASQGVDLEISAQGSVDIDGSETYDVVLLGPQVAYQIETVKEKVGPETPVDVIPMRDYGRQNCAAIFELIEDLLLDV